MMRMRSMSAMTKAIVCTRVVKLGTPSMKMVSVCSTRVEKSVKVQIQMLYTKQTFRMCVHLFRAITDTILMRMVSVKKLKMVVEVEMVLVAQVLMVEVEVETLVEVEVETLVEVEVEK